jgi:uncharacterized protein (DUF433 family)
MDLPDFLTRWPNGEIVLTGHRIGRYSLIDLCQQGFSPDQIRDAFPSLEPELIRSIIAFHEGQRAEVDAFVAEYPADLDSQEVAPRLRSSGISPIRPESWPWKSEPVSL